MITPIKGLSQSMGDESYADDFMGCPACRDQGLKHPDGRIAACICEHAPDTDRIGAALHLVVSSIDVEASQNERTISYAHEGLAGALVQLVWEVESLKKELATLR